MLRSRAYLAMAVVRPLSTSRATSGFRDMFYDPKDAKKRPSQLEIKAKDLPQNTPTLEERIRRDRKAVFFEMDRKGGYYRGKTGTVRDYAEGADTKTVLTEGYRFLVDETKKFMAHEFLADPFASLPVPGETRVEWSFEEENAAETQWVTTADSDWGEGYSNCQLKRSEDGRFAVFSGELSTRVPRDGRTHNAGYCNAATVRRRKAFNRPAEMQWDLFTDLVLWVRGDGRTYRANIHCPGEFDIGWNDVWCFPIFTRGGPYWQYIKIPFSKFYFTNRGFIQDDQMRVRLSRMTGFSITLDDKIDGPFRLEIEKVGVRCGYHLPETTEEFRYESYYYPYPNFTKN